MRVNADMATGFVWAAWFVSWWGAAWWSDRTVHRPSAGRQMIYRAFTMTGAVLLFINFRPGPSSWILWRLGSSRWACVAVIAAGLLFTWWARVYLGRLWSGSITRKASHHVVATGPYALVRHPIYTGIIAAEIATAIQSGTLQTFAGVALMIAGFYIKARMEESFLRTELDPAAYAAYARRVPMLIPFLRISRAT